MKQSNVFTHVALSIIGTILVVMIYVAVQQTYRSGADDPQLQIARDISDDLRRQDEPDKWVAGDKIDISAVFNVFYNDKGEALAGTGSLNGKIPSLPHGVFDIAKDKGENVFTWQPAKGTRMAVVLKSLNASSYSYVAVGKSLYEVEKREATLGWMCVIGWVLCMAIVLFHWVINFIRSPWDNKQSAL